MVEQRLDHRVGEPRLGARDDATDQRVERGAAILAEQRPQRGLDPPATADRQLLPGARLEQAGEDADGAVAYLHALRRDARPSTRSAMRAAIAAGDGDGRGEARRARRCPACPRPPTVCAVLRRDLAARRDDVARADHAVAAHAAQHDGEGARAVTPRATDCEHRIDRRQAAATAPGSRSSWMRTMPPHRSAAGYARRRARPGCRRGATACPSRATSAGRPAMSRHLRGEIGHEGGGQMLRDQDRRDAGLPAAP